jgi:hypothetical protein
MSRSVEAVCSGDSQTARSRTSRIKAGLPLSADFGSSAHKLCSSCVHHAQRARANEFKTTTDCDRVDPSR